MARGVLTVQARPHATMNLAPGSATLTMTNGDPTNGHQFPLTGRELLIAANTGASPRWVRVVGAADAYGRTGTTGQYAIAAGGIAVVAVSPVDVWAQAGTVAHVDVEHADIKLAVVRYP